MAFSLPTARTTGDTISASIWNSDIRTNMQAIWVGTTAGDLDYYTGATAKSRLGLTTGGVLYGGASAPAWLALGTQGYVMRAGASAPEYVVSTNLPGSMHKYTAASSTAGGSTASTSLVDVSGLSATLVTTVTCHIFAWVHASLNASGAGKFAYLTLNIAGTAIPALSNASSIMTGTSPTPTGMASKADSVAAGTITVKAQMAADSASTTTCTGGYLMAMAIVA